MIDKIVTETGLYIMVGESKVNVRLCPHCNNIFPLAEHEYQLTYDDRTP